MCNICVVLVQPQGPLNVGSVCRSMMNFGIFDLRLVKPCAEYNSFEARRMALKAVNILEKARIFTTLQEAVEDCSVLFGTTRRFSKHRIKESFLSPERAAEEVSILPNETQVGYVFGREDVGLHNTELEVCNFHVTIPTDNSYMSMNLSHAVSLCMYELKKKDHKNLVKTDMFLTSLAISKDTERMFKQMKNTLLNIGYLNQENPEHITRVLRKILNRAKLDDREVRIFRGLWSRIDWIEKERIKKSILEKNDPT